jgi:hypothetical protein
MKINKEALRLMSEKNDAELWGEIQRIAKSKGYNLPVNAPSHSDMEKIRSAMRGADRINLSDAARILNNYKKKD